MSASIGLIDKVAAKFLPTSVRFTYFWTMREMTNLFQNMCLAKDKYYGTGDALAKLWCHECRRVLADRLITIDETKIIDDMIGECHADHLKKQGVSADVLLNDAENANIYTTFTAVEPDGAYRPIDDLAQLSKVLEAKLVEYLSLIHI